MPAHAKKAMAVRAVANPPFMILPMGEIDAKGKNPDVRSGFDTVILLYIGRSLFLIVRFPLIMM
jgi:hypothetical protein